MEATTSIPFPPRLLISFSKSQGQYQGLPFPPQQCLTSVQRSGDEHCACASSWWTSERRPNHKLGTDKAVPPCGCTCDLWGGASCRTCGHRHSRGSVGGVEQGGVLGPRPTRETTQSMFIWITDVHTHTYESPPTHIHTRPYPYLGAFSFTTWFCLSACLF